MDYYNKIAESGYSNRVTWSKVGYNAAVTTEQDMAPWLASGSTPALLYSFPVAELAMTIVSSSNTDTGLTGMIKTYTITAGGDQGSGYHANDIITITQGGASGGQIKVLTIGAGGEIATSELHACGSAYTVANDLATTVSPAGGTGCLVNITAVSTQSTGARTATVYYLDDDFLEYNVTVTLNGDTPVKIASNIYRIQNARLVTTGSGNVPVGNISIKNSTSTYGYISLGKTRMRQCVWTVPSGKTLYISNLAFSSVGQSAAKYTRFTTRANFDDKSGLVLQRGLYMPFHELLQNNTSFTKEFYPPTKLPATTDLKVSAFADSTCIASCVLRGYVVTG